jgi:hypothetical protein
MDRFTRRAVIFGAPGLLVIRAASSPPRVEVYKTPTCGCCGKWVTHMKDNGFDVVVHNVENTASYRRQFGVPDKVASCHTGVVNGYAIEGHVPAEDVQRLLKERPAKAKGIAVPGMPLGSPGMDQGPGRAAYDVLLFNEQGETSIFRQYAAR